MSTKKREGKFAELQKYNRYAIVNGEDGPITVIEFQVRIDLPYYNEMPDYWVFVERGSEFHHLGDYPLAFYDIVKGVVEWTDADNVKIYSTALESNNTKKNFADFEIIEDYHKLNEMPIHREIKWFINDLNGAVAERQWEND